MRTPLLVSLLCSLLAIDCSRPTPELLPLSPAAAASNEVASVRDAHRAPRPVVEPSRPEKGAATPEPDSVGLGEEEARAAALHAIEDGRVQTLYIGEPGPVDYVDTRTGLPASSTGCEWDEETEAFVEAYNAAVTNWWADAAPFFDGAAITFRRRGAGENLLVEVRYDEVLVTHGSGIAAAVDSGFSERLSIAAWVSTADSPRTEPEGLSTPFDSIEWRGWSTRWQFGEAPPVDVRAIQLLEEFAGRPR